VDYTLPDPQRFQALVEHTEALLKELHEVLMQPFAINFKAALEERAKNPSSEVNPFTTADAMREPIFYGAEAAYIFQYRDLAARKYARDERWLKDNRGFSIEEARQVALAMGGIRERRLLSALQEMKTLPPEKWTILDGLSFLSLKSSQPPGCQPTR
jgi:hypothetical protein